MQAQNGMRKSDVGASKRRRNCADSTTQDRVSNPSLPWRIGPRDRGGETLQVGNLAVSRDYTDVRDVVNAYIVLAHEDAQGNHNICTESNSHFHPSHNA